MVFTRVVRSGLAGPWSGTPRAALGNKGRPPWRTEQMGVAASRRRPRGGGLTLVATPQAQAADWNRCLTGQTDRQAVFERASAGQRRAGQGAARRLLPRVPLGRPRQPGQQLRRLRRRCTSPRTRPRRTPARLAQAKGDGSPAALATGTLTAAAKITGIGRAPAALRRRRQRLRRRGGARVLPAGHHLGPSGRVEQGGRLVRRHRRRPGPAGLRPAGVLRDPLRRVPHHQRRAAGDAGADAGRRRRQRPPWPRRSRPATTWSTARPCCACESRPAPYEQYGSTPSQYGNHDIANRPKDGLSIDYIVIHDTEAYWQTRWTS